MQWKCIGQSSQMSADDGHSSNSPIALDAERIMPYINGHLIEGKVIFVKIVHPLAPIIAAASSSSVPLASRTGTISRNTIGSVTNTVTMIIPEQQILHRFLPCQAEDR